MSFLSSQFAPARLPSSSHLNLVSIEPNLRRTHPPKLRYLDHHVRIDLANSMARSGWFRGNARLCFPVKSRMIRSRGILCKTRAVRNKLTEHSWRESSTLLSQYSASILYTSSKTRMEKANLICPINDC